MDCKFDVGLQGVQGLEKIRQKTSLVSIVMMSANALKSDGKYRFGSND